MREKSCSNCKKGLFELCDELRNNKEFQELDDFMDKAHYKSDYICDEYNSMYIEYPIEVSKINYDNNKNTYRDDDIGKFVKICPCAEEYDGKTYLGLYLGNLPVSHRVSHNRETKELTVSNTTNPAIYVFDIQKIVYGMESWWGIIETEEDLKEITTEDINNIWYVKALQGIK